MIKLKCGEFHAYQNEYGVTIPIDDGQLNVHHIKFVCCGGTDEPDNLIHYKHMACNMAFICALMAEKDSADTADRCAACGEVIPEGIQICPNCGRK